MTFGLVLLVLVGAGRAAAAPSPAPPACRGERPIVVHAERLVDGTGSEPLADAVVVIRGKRIQSLGRRSDFHAPPCAQVLEVVGATVLPGLIDAHVHLSRLLHSDPRALERWLRGGVTTLVDLGSAELPDDLRATVARAVPVAPRILAAGPILTAPGGYPFARDGSSALEVRDPKEAIAAVSRLAEHGADLVKVAVERGFLADLDAEGWPVPAAEPLEAIAAAAHGRGLRVTAHLTQRGELDAALAAGFDDLAHAPIDRLTEGQLRELARRDVVLTTTASLWVDDPEHLAIVCSNLRGLLDAGGHVALGTDAPAFQSPGLPAVEIGRLAACGLSPMEILVAATRDAARTVGRQNELGVLRPGALADLVVVEGNPLEDLAALRTVRIVVRDGEIAYLHE